MGAGCSLRRRGGAGGRKVVEDTDGFGGGDSELMCRDLGLDAYS